MHHPTDRIAHTTAFVTPVVEHWLERELAQWVCPMKDRSDDPSHHERTRLPVRHKDHIDSDSNRPHIDTVGNAMMPRLTSAQHNNAIRILLAESTQQTKARHFGISRQTFRVWYNTNQTVNNKPRSGSEM